MKLIVISSAAPVPNEHQLINSLFEEGLEHFHIHKPGLSKTETEKFIQQIPATYRDKVFLHSEFPKFHSLEELAYPSRSLEPQQMIFLSPIFDSISKEGYKSNFSDRMHAFTQLKPELMTAIKGKNVIALGGVDEDKIELVKKVGFAGAAMLGAIWNSKNPVDKFVKINNIIHSKAFLREELFREEFSKTPSDSPKDRPL